MVTVFLGSGLSQRAALPSRSNFPPGSLRLHGKGVRTVNGPAAEFAFWTAAGTTSAMAVAAPRAAPSKSGPATGPAATSRGSVTGVTEST